MMIKHSDNQNIKTYKDLQVPGHKNITRSNAINKRNSQE